MMTGREALLIDLDQELAMTRRVLERAPHAAWTWRPHPRSFTLAELATHLTNLPLWGVSILTKSSHDLATGGGPRTVLPSLAEALTAWDANTAVVRRRLLDMSDAELMAPWSLVRGAQTLFTMPRAMALRRYLVHHVVHHRAQLMVYLRLNDVPVPAVYGPTADEPL